MTLDRFVTDVWAPQRVAAWQAARIKAGAGRKAIREALSLLGGLMGYAVELEHLQVNAARAVRPVRRAPRKTGRALSAREVEALRSTLSEPWPVLVSMLAYSGMRPGRGPRVALGGRSRGRAARRAGGKSLRRLNARHEDRHGTHDRAARPARRRSRGVAPALRTASQDRARVRAHPSGSAWMKTLWDNWRRREFAAARRAAEIGELRPYDLRHTFASLLLAEGRSIHYVAEQLGHGAEQTLRTYGHVIAVIATARRSTPRQKSGRRGRRNTGRRDGSITHDRSTRVARGGRPARSACRRREG